MNATRERQAQFFKERGYDALENAVLQMIRRHGADWLSSGQMAELVHVRVAQDRFEGALKRRNRRLFSTNSEPSRRALSAEDRADIEYQQSREEWKEAAE